MFKVSSTKLIRIEKALLEANKAINILERANNNTILFNRTKTELTGLAEEINSQYGLKDFTEHKK